MIIEQDYDHFIASFKQQFNMDIASYKQDRMRVESMLLFRERALRTTLVF